MKSKQLITKAMTLTLIGATILGSSSSLYAKSYKKPNKTQSSSSCKPGTSVKPQKPNCGTNNGTNDDANAGDTNTDNNTNTGNDNTTDNNTNSGDTNVGTDNNTNNDANSGNTNTGNGNCGNNNAGTNNGTNNNTNTGTNNSTNNDTNAGTNNGINNNTGNGTTTDNNTSTDTNVSTQAAYENKVLELVNAERAKQGLKALQMDESVRNVARLKSTDMKNKNYFSHTSPTYGTPFQMLKQFGISYKSAGENIAQGYKTPEEVVKGWMNSPGHKANILNASYTHIGIGYEASGSYWTQVFIGK